MLDIDSLNRTFAQLSAEERILRFYELFPKEEVLVTSSFGTTAAVLLHHISRLQPKQAVYFVDTRYHFPETQAYKNNMIERLKLNVLDIRPTLEGHAYTKKEQLWKSQPDLCCQINKVSPLEIVKSKYKVWISGLMAYQSPFRKSLNVFEEKEGIIKFHPFIDWQAEEVSSYFQHHQLPKHPLEKKGYQSIGCAQCTAKGKGREGRWKGKAKVECGLHVAA